MDNKKRLYVQNVTEWQNEFDKKYFSTRQLEVKTVKKAIVLPTKKREDLGKHCYAGGVCDENFNFVAGYFRSGPKRKNSWNNVEHSYSVPSTDIKYVDEDVIFGGVIICQFGHLFVESISRLWYIVKNRPITKKVVFVTVSTWQVKNWMYELFNLLGITPDKVEFVKSPTQYRSITIPDQSVYLANDYTNEYVSIYDHLMNLPKSGPRYKKVMLTRSSDLNSASYLCNVKYFENYFFNKGFKIIHPEKLSIYEQVAIVSQADEVVTFLGSLSHWALIMKPNTKLIMLTRVPDTNNMQCLIHNIRDLDWYLIDTSMNFLRGAQGEGTCLVGPTDHFKEFVKDHYNEDISYDEVPTSTSIDYIERWIKYYKNRPNNEEVLNLSIKNLFTKLQIEKQKSKINRPILCYQSHVSRKGWMHTNVENDISGVISENLAIEAIKIYFYEPFINILYSVYYSENDEWTKEIGNGEVVGTIGKFKSIYGLKIRLTSNEYNIYYRIHTFEKDWSDWKKNGEPLTSPQSPINGIQIKLEKV